MKKIILLALAAASVAAFALPASAMAIVPVHVVPKPEGVKTVDGVGSATLTGLGTTITCAKSHGTATFTTTTTGTFEQTFSECVNGSGKKCTTSGQAVGVITTATLEFHLATVEDTTTKAIGPGLLVTPPAGGFATFLCEGGINTTVSGNGLIGTITQPACGSSSKEATISFSSSSSTVQTHKTLAGTATEWSLNAFGFPASEDAHGTITLGTEAKLECT